MSYRNIPSSQPHRRPRSSQGPPLYTSTPVDSSQNLALPARDPSAFADPTASPVPSIAGDFANLNPVPRSVRGARSFSSPSPAIGLHTGPTTGSPFLSPPGVYPAGQSAQSRAQLSPDPRYSPSRSAAVGSDYLTGSMAHEAHNWGWQGRPAHPHLQHPVGFDQPYSPQPAVAPGGFPINYNARQGTPRNYYQSSPYLSVPHAHHPRSVSMSYAYPSSSVTGTLPSVSDQSFLPSSPSYFPHQPEYYLPEASLPSHAPSIPTSPQPHPGPGPGPSPYYPSLSPAPASASASSSTDQDRQVRVISFRPKPQCWEHGCNGREFSTFSNLLRHQREKSGVVAKAECPVCGAAFTRTTARNIHLAQGKCKGRE